MGYAVICPHKNTSMFDGECEELIWLNGYLEILKRCDIVIITHNWDESDGAIKEVAFADSLGIPVMSFHKGLVEIKDFLNEDRKCPV
jgi:nucleoside 2-deoxyribosyltransferase